MIEIKRYIKTLEEIDRRLAHINKDNFEDEIYDLRSEIWNEIVSYTGGPITNYKEVLRG